MDGCASPTTLQLRQLRRMTTEVPRRLRETRRLSSISRCGAPGCLGAEWSSAQEVVRQWDLFLSLGAIGPFVTGIGVIKGFLVSCLCFFTGGV